MIPFFKENRLLDRLLQPGALKFFMFLLQACPQFVESGGVLVALEVLFGVGSAVGLSELTGFFVAGCCFGSAAFLHCVVC